MSDFKLIQAQSAVRLRAAAQEKGFPSILELFTERVGRLLAEIEQASTAGGLAEYTFAFSDGGRETFVLHSASNRSRVAGGDPPANKRTGPEALVGLLESAMAVPSFNAAHRHALVNYTSRRGTTPLAVGAAHARALLRLGADPVLAMDGALYVAIKENNPHFVMTLLESVKPLFQKDQLMEIVNHTRVDGVDAVSAAIRCGSRGLAHLLIELGVPAARFAAF